jgi:16S rRNA (guanine966-N2)-methyltransferase
VREALFSGLEATIGLVGAKVLDLYAGSGALGLEALSRGAAEVVLVESDRKAVQVLRRNVAELGLPGARVVPASVRAVLAGSSGTTYDIVLADPPYELSNGELREILDLLVINNWLAVDGRLVLERAKRDGVPELPPALVVERDRVYGDTVLHWCVFAE